MSTADIVIPPKLIPVFSGKSRYRGAYGGRGSGKTRTFALMTAVWAYMHARQGTRGTILCGREYMNSLDDSSMEEVKEAIRSTPFLNDFFEIGDKFIRTRCRTVWYTFAGLRYNLDSIKSRARILLSWVDEAENVSEVAWQKLIPTVREEGSEIWVTWNPENEDSATDRRFRKIIHDKVVEVNYYDNPFFPSTLERERLDCLENDPDNYAWIWEGAYRVNSDAQILAGKISVEEFEAQDDWTNPMYGVDWGFASDPTAGVRCWVRDRVLYVDYEAYKKGVENDDLADYLIKCLPGIETRKSYADNSRPETISHVKKKTRYRPAIPLMEACKKWPGSVEDGISHLRSYKKIVVHPRCKNLIKESSLYRYKTDKNSGAVLPQIVDKDNHLIDALRYALGPLISRGGPAGMLMKRR